MTLECVKIELQSLKSDSHQKFQEKLIPGSRIILGVKNQPLRQIAKKISEGNYQKFLDDNDFSSHELMMIQAFLIGLITDDVIRALKYFDHLVQHINDWAVCDALCSSFVIAKKEQNLIFDFIINYQNSTHPFAIRTLAVMLLCHFINDDYLDKVILILDNIESDNYYVKMGIAWAFATIMTKYPQVCLNHLPKSNLDKWTFNKAIQKMIESRAISLEHKTILKEIKKSRNFG